MTEQPLGEDMDDTVAQLVHAEQRALLELRELQTICRVAILYLGEGRHSKAVECLRFGLGQLPMRPPALRHPALRRHRA